MKITTFNKPNIKALRAEIADALQSIEARYGVHFNIGRITFENDEWRGKMTCSTTTPQEKRANNLEANTGPIAVGDIFQRKRTFYTVQSVGNPGVHSVQVMTQRGKRGKIRPADLLALTKVS